jgi:hypothetical protein
MPNPSNVMFPINIHGIGRSGTTLLQNILGAAGFIQVCNETNQFVFGTFRAGELLSSSHDVEAPGGQPGMATRCLYAALCAAMPSSKASWCHKVGGIPNGLSWQGLVTAEDVRFAEHPYQFPYAWFWKVLSVAFPFSRNVLIIRDYRDIILSSEKSFGYHQLDVTRDVATYLNVLSHSSSRIDHVIHYDSLMRAPETTINDLCASLGITYSKGLLQALDWHAAPTPGRDLDQARATGFSWSGQYAMLAEETHRIIAGPLDRLASRLGEDVARWAGHEG